ncbi:MAG: hypothetical protein K2Z81_13525 [Cyanobacteria bacterium]|nr:hypothetical protein [Cyanobacteriota bacterium]
MLRLIERLKSASEAKIMYTYLGDESEPRLENPLLSEVQPVSIEVSPTKQRKISSEEPQVMRIAVKQLTLYKRRPIARAPTANSIYDG